MGRDDREAGALINDASDDDRNSAPAAFAQFVVTDERSIRKEVIELFPRMEIRVGRDKTRCDFHIPNGHVSKSHFRIYSIVYETGMEDLFPPLVYCEDLESSNGTYVNNELIGMLGKERIGYLLSDGDVVEVRPFWRFKFSQRHSNTSSWDPEELKDLEYFSNCFEISERILGQGQSGKVYLANYANNRRQMACKVVKVLHPEPNSWETESQQAAKARKAALREIQLLARLDHPHVVKLEKAFCSRKILYIFTELAAAGDLFSYLESNGGVLDDCHSRVITLQIVIAVQYIHSKGVVHRDIKPENVLVTHTDFGGRVVLTDFGYAKQVDQRSNRLMSVLGTSGYCAPEVETAAETMKGYTMAADLWSLGVLTACLLTGDKELPACQFTMGEMTQEGLSDLLYGESASEMWQDMSPTAKRFLCKLLVIDSNQRMSAKEARNHAWFKRPRSEAALLEDRYDLIIRFWRGRENNDEVIEYLPQAEPEPPQVFQQQARVSRKIPDTSASVYFNLDRHLHQRKRPQRHAVLDTLNKTGASFLSPEGKSKNGSVPPNHAQKSKCFPRNLSELDQNVSIFSTSGKDLFRTMQQGRTQCRDVSSFVDAEEEEETILDQSLPKQASSIANREVDEESASQAEIRCRRDKFMGNAPDAQQSCVQKEHELVYRPSPPKEPNLDTQMPRSRKRPRTGSWSESDRRVHSTVSKSYQHFTSAKTFRNAALTEMETREN
ncbi:kinase-like domain-containing protein [Amylocarpus encephaloides]|uniref:Kinase-like domain-containing protein n=1 Tax=Amylocarpus encephaloides TaxID=45428 RepID=A0A9P7YFV1_9HELO|nr:kinase-like domain-containing protein [Amylocarpus encephaloides]